MIVSKEPIKLRGRKNKTGVVSLYLDIYYKGKRSYEYLKMYLIPEQTRIDKEKNKETLRFAEAVRAKRIVELRNGEYGFQVKASNDMLFYDFCQTYLTSFNEDKIIIALLKHIKIYDSRVRLKFSDITRKWVQGFRDYLNLRAVSQKEVNSHKKVLLSDNSKWIYFNKLKTLLNKAQREGVISQNPIRNIKGFKYTDTSRMYLTLDEVRTLAQTQCNAPIIKRMFLFSCLTGLRWSDISTLKWKNVFQQKHFTRIIFRQKKTKGQEYVDISSQATELLGEQCDDEQLVFYRKYSLSYTTKVLRQWVRRAGIEKNITFHCARHTFAVMMLDLGTDIFTVSKLLGHRELSTTQVYAKILDKNKQEAVQRIPSIFSESVCHRVFTSN